MTVTADGSEVLRWDGRLLTAAALDRSLDGHRRVQLPRGAVVTPLAAERLRERKVEVVAAAETPAATAGWGCCREREWLLVASGILTLRRAGMSLQELPGPRGDDAAGWAREAAAAVASGQCDGVCAFCADPGLFCCVANKLSGVRAVAVTTVRQAARATLTVGANLLAVEMPGRTFFEIRQILALACGGGRPACPGGPATTLREMDGHAHS